MLSAALGPSTRALLRRAGIPDASRILDLGCGGGDVTRTIAEMAPAALVDGVDFDPVVAQLATDEARRLGVTNVRYLVGDATDLDLERERYDIVYRAVPPLPRPPTRPSPRPHVVVDEAGRNHRRRGRRHPRRGVFTLSSRHSPGPTN